jgi:hypothetical protein
LVKRVYAFSEGNKEMKALLGGKGANLGEMVNMGLRVPPGFTITPLQLAANSSLQAVSFQKASGRKSLVT